MEKLEQKTSTLGFALLGLLKMQPATGYELRKIFQDTPMAGYSSSPGAIYPALKSLELRKLIRSRTGVGKTGQETQTWQCTAEGTRTLLDWLKQEVTVDSVFSELDVVLLRFSYLDLVDDLEWSIKFLDQFKLAMNLCLDRLKELRKSLAAEQPLHGRLALSNGVQILEAHIMWTEFATTQINERRKIPQ